MPLTSPIPMKLYDNPAVGYAELAATVPHGGRYIQDFLYETVENPEASTQEYLEVLYPDATVLGADGDVGSWEIGQGMLGSCGHFSAIAAYASAPDPYRLESGIYPTEISPISLYLVRIQDPGNPLGVKWVAIDSKIPTKPGGKSYFIYLPPSKAIAPMLAIKAEWTARGGCPDETTNHPALNLPFNWFPSVKIKCQTFADLSDAISRGGLFVFSMTQQYDTAGVAATIPGVVLGHGFSAPDTLSTINSDGSPVNLIRIENPWLGGTDLSSDLNAYSENSAFWVEHPELANKLADAKASAGNCWVSWNQFCQLAGQTSFDVTHPLPLPSHPYIKFLPYTFDDSTAIASATVANLKTLAETRKDYIDITLAEATPILASLKWANGTGDRHTSIILVDPTGKVSGTQTVYWAGSKTVTIYAKAGLNRIYLRTTKMSVDRGDLQVILMAAKDFGLSVGGEIA